MPSEAPELSQSASYVSYRLSVFQQFAFSRHITAVTLRRNILAHRFDCFPGDDFSPYGSLYGNIKLMPRNQLLELFTHLRPKATALSACVNVDNASTLSPFKSMSSFTSFESRNHGDDNQTRHIPWICSLAYHKSLLQSHQEVA